MEECRNQVIKLHATYSRILVNSLVILVKTPVNLLVEPTKLRFMGEWDGYETNDGITIKNPSVVLGLQSITINHYYGTIARNIARNW